MTYVIEKSQVGRKLDWLPKGGIVKGMHDQADKEGKSLTEFLEDIKTQEMSKESPYVGMTQTEMIQKRLDDPKSPMLAVEEFIKAAGIDLKRDTVSKFFEFSDIAPIFPEYYKNQVVAGMLKSGLVSQLVMASNLIPSENYFKLYLEETEKERQLSKVAPGEPFPRTRMSISKQSIYLQKYARMLEIPDESIKYQRLPLFAACLQQIGLEFDICRTNDCIYVLVNGDGNSNTPDKTVSGSVGSVAVLFEFYIKLDIPYKINKMIIHKTELATYLVTLTGFSAPQAQFKFLPLATPEWFEWDDTSALAAERILGLDTRYAVEEVHTGGVKTENDRLIDGQINRTGISWTGGYSVYQNKAVCLWTVT